MARFARLDAPGVWHHVMNRGIAKRTLFETRRDIRRFLAGLARAVRARRLEVHAYCVLTTHFHLLVRSPGGQLSDALHDLQNGYSRWFNRSRRRDGPLFRGRFRSKPVDSADYRVELVRYIDENAVQAGLVETPAAYPYASAAHYARLDGPIWLARGWIEGLVRRRTRAPVYDPQRYAEAFGAPLAAGLRRLIERRIELQDAGIDPLGELLGAAPARVLAWMRWKAELADGTQIGIPVCDAQEVARVVAEERARRGGWALAGAGIAPDAWAVAEVGLLRELCGATLAEAGERTGCSANGAFRREARHRRALLEDELYAQRVSELAARALEGCHGVRRGSRRARAAREW